MAILWRNGTIISGNRYKSKKTQNSSVFLDNGGKEVSVDDSLLDEEESSVSSQAVTSKKSSSLEDKLDKFFSEFANLSQRIKT